MPVKRSIPLVIEELMSKENHILSLIAQDSIIALRFETPEGYRIQTRSVVVSTIILVLGLVVITIMM